MSTVTNNLESGNVLFNTYDYRKIFLYRNRVVQAGFKNNRPAIASFSMGTILARDVTDNNLVPFDSTITTNGQNQPVGVLGSNVSNLASNGTISPVLFGFTGEMNRDLLIFARSADSLATVIDGRTVEDILLRQGIKLTAGMDLTPPDNT